MKKILLVLCIIGVCSQELQAQAKQRKMLLLQIAALQTYIGYAKKGYTVVKNGLNFISDVKKGEVNLHGNYFTSLKKVNPKVKNYVKVAEIISLQIKIIKIHKKAFELLGHNDLFHGDELDYIERTFEKLIDNCNETLDQLLVITTDIKLEMTDDQRIERIDALHKTMTDDYCFCENFSREIKVLSLSKAKEKNDVKQSQVLLGL
ncbi:hypothetical protein C8C83_4511 [Flavobacterium sp. 90]|uniref:hypothetical protein n=1 Tax=unclassified Flavobacterium TaxID=196869 RepID=UPI000EAFCECD|nr:MULTISPECIES: hypothetical protein [unclassified Flavobacterium]RKR05178.1 hypothetical protein C8C82_4852 [Flavobacterium sp. 81]TCK56494.1 hypothetical protein C8C83_4511 [Flavobacterium sp. 90]